MGIGRTGLLAWVIAPALALLGFDKGAAEDRLAFEWFQRLGTGPGMAFAPDGLSDVASLIYLGTRGDAEAALHFDWFDGLSREALFEAARARELAEGRSPSGYRSLVSLWHDPSIPVAEAYRQQVAEAFGADVLPAPLASDPVASAATLNAWVNEQSRGALPKLFEPEELPMGSGLVPAAISLFDCPWADDYFKKTLTSPERFYASREEHSLVQMMKARTHLRYWEGAYWTTVRLRYRNSDLSLLLALPNDPNDFSGAVKQIDRAWFEKVHESAEAHETILWLPRVKYMDQRDWTRIWREEDAMASLFQGKADLSGITGEHGVPYRLTGVQQVVIVRWDEEGTRIHAGSAAVVEPFGDPPKPPEPKRFLANRPFAWFVYREDDLRLLFSGVVSLLPQMEQLREIE